MNPNVMMKRCDSIKLFFTSCPVSPPFQDTVNLMVLLFVDDTPVSEPPSFYLRPTKFKGQVWRRADIAMRDRVTV